MKQYMAFIEKYAVEKRFYCRVHDVYKKNEWEVSWQRRDGGGEKQSWAFKSLEAKQWDYFSSSELIQILNHNKVDVFGFEAELQCKIKNMIVFASLMQKEARKLMGDDIVEASIAEYDEFANAMIETIKQLLPEAKSSAAAPVEQGVLSDKKEPRLKLVTSNSKGS